MPLALSSSRERLAVLHERAARRPQRAVAADERRDVLRTRAQLLVESAGEIVRHAHVDEPAGKQEHDGHRECKDERQPQP